jgi:hypothetical protein
MVDALSLCHPGPKPEQVFAGVGQSPFTALADDGAHGAHSSSCFPLPFVVVEEQVVVCAFAHGVVAPGFAYCWHDVVSGG